MGKIIGKKKIQQERIFEISTLVAGNLSLQEVLDRLAETAVEITNVKACSIRLLDVEAGELRMRSTFGLSEIYRNKGAVSKNDMVIKMAFAGNAVVIDDMRTDHRVKYKDAAIQEGLVSQLTVAMKFKNNPIGVLRLYSPRPKHFNKNDIALARLVASQCAVAITNARLYSKAVEGARMAEQMRLAGIIQRRMIPQNSPLMPGLDIAAVYRPCFDIGGDLYDFVKIGGDQIALIIADVIGKGVPAALMMSMLKGTFRAYIEQAPQQYSMAELIKMLNATACRQCQGGEFITMFIGWVDTAAMKITYCNCGHEPAVLIRNRRCYDFDKGGLVLGLMENARYQIETVRLKDKDTLLFYTDGLIDATNFQQKLWGRARMLAVAKNFTDGPARRTIDSLIQYRRRFIGLCPQNDDTSVIVVKVDRTSEPFFA
ncbi:MAG: GAF domain-containing SpoIIE family protein phosphatase [Planctomycetota bacterium]